MSLKGLLALADSKLHEAYDHVEPNFDKARATLKRASAKALKQFQEGKQPRGEGKWWTANNNVVRFTPHYEGKRIDLGDPKGLAVPAERFPDVLREFDKATDAGELDRFLDTSAPAKASRPGNPGKRGPLSEEALAKRREGMAQRGTKGGKKAGEA